MGIFPLGLVMVFITLCAVFFMRGKEVLTLSNIARFKLTWIQCVQVALFGTCGIYALVTYAMRSKRIYNFGGLEGMAYSAFLVCLFVGAGLGRCWSDSEDEDNDGERDRERNRQTDKQTDISCLTLPPLACPPSPPTAGPPSFSLSSPSPSGSFLFPASSYYHC